MNSTFYRPNLTGFAQSQYHNKKSGNGFLKMLPPDDDGITPKPTDVPDAILNPRYEVDFTTLSCKALNQLMGELTAFMTTARFTPSQLAYYNSKMETMKAIYKQKCSGDAPPDITTVLVPVVPVQTGNSNVPYSGSAAGGGGGAETSKKKTCGWWCIIAIAATAFTIYKTYKSKAA